MVASTGIATAQVVRFKGSVPTVCTVQPLSEQAGLSSDLAVFCNVSDGATLYASLVGEGARDYALMLDGREIATDPQAETIVRRYATAVSRRETMVLRKRSEDTASPPPRLMFRIVAGG